jgi:glycosyltransferase involved in cell wall biosynthesis
LARASFVRRKTLVDGENIKLVGELNDSAKGDLLRGALALLFPIDWPEPFGRVMIEAMALGCPVIAPREGGPLFIVRDGETGMLVPPRDPDALAEALLALLAEPARRTAMGRAGRARVDAVFDIRHHVGAMEALFEEILAARQRLRPQRQHT